MINKLALMISLNGSIPVGRKKFKEIESRKAPSNAIPSLVVGCGLLYPDWIQAIGTSPYRVVHYRYNWKLGKAERVE